MKPDRRIFFLSLAASLQFLAAGTVTLSLPADPKNAVLWGFSAVRLAFIGFCALLGLAALGLGLAAQRRGLTVEGLLRFLRARKMLAAVYLLLFLLALWGWTAVFAASAQFGRFMYFFERLRPASLAAGLVGLELLALLLHTERQTCFRALFRRAARTYGLPVLIWLVGLLGLAAFIAVTRIGVARHPTFWNVPGVPLSGLQFFGLVFLTGLGAAASAVWSARHPDTDSDAWRWIIRLLPLAMFITAVLVWGATPLVKDTLSLRPTAPQIQPYPNQDARVHDLGAISVIKGAGIFFHSYTDKPLYMVLLAGFHLVAGYDFWKISWLHMAFMALIPAALFWFGKKFQGVGFGLLLAGAILLRQRNAIVLSDEIASVNPKLLMTEMMTLLGLVLLTGLLFLWFRTRKPWLALLSGGVLGAVSLVRLNPLILIPAVIALCVPVFWRARLQMVKHIAWFMLGALILLLPWVIGGVNQEGVPWLYLKFRDVINIRYNDSLPTGPRGVSAAHFGLIPQPVFLTGTEARCAAQEQARLGGFASAENCLSPRSLPNVNENVTLIFRHYLHNFVTSMLALPDAIPYQDIATLSQREYWKDANKWDGALPTGQSILILCNLGLIALGLGYSWKRFGWAGLVPLFIFVVYSAALALAMNSGGRYIVPVDWILYFYELLAFVLIIQYVLRALDLGGGTFFQPGVEAAAALASLPARDRRALWGSLVGLVLLASLVPVTNNLIPLMVPVKNIRPEAEAAKKIIAYDPARGESLIDGEILYPYHNDDGKIEFTLLSGPGIQRIDDFMLPNLAVNVALYSGDWVILRVKTEDDIKTVETMYRVRGDLLELVWPKVP